MVVIADSDCVRKLAYCDFLGEFLQLIQVPPNDIWVLPALAYQMRRKLSACPEALADFEKFLKRTKSIPTASVAMLVRFETLDEGEQQIFALMCEIDRIELVVTGDRDAMRKVAALVHKDPSLGALMKDSEIWCFETIIVRLMKRQGLSITRARMERWRRRQGSAMDSAMNTIFTDACTEQSVYSDLKTRIDALRASCVGIPIQS